VEALQHEKEGDASSMEILMPLGPPSAYIGSPTFDVLLFPAKHDVQQPSEERQSGSICHCTQRFV